jgi:hypothetical protein
MLSSVAGDSPTGYDFVDLSKEHASNIVSKIEQKWKLI